MILLLLLLLLLLMEILVKCFQFSRLFKCLFACPQGGPQFIVPTGQARTRGRFELAFSQIGGSVMAGKFSQGPEFQVKLAYCCCTTSGTARAFLDGRTAHLEEQNEEENLRKMRKTTGKWGKSEEMFLSCPPESKRLATTLWTTLSWMFQYLWQSQKVVKCYSHVLVHDLTSSSKDQKFKWFFKLLFLP